MATLLLEKHSTILSNAFCYAFVIADKFLELFEIVTIELGKCTNVINVFLWSSKSNKFSNWLKAFAYCMQAYSGNVKLIYYITLRAYLIHGEKKPVVLTFHSDFKILIVMLFVSYIFDIRIYVKIKNFILNKVV